MLECGRNCDAIRHADRFTTLIDGAAYFATLRAALIRARHTVFIVGWDLDSRMRLVPDGANDGFPEPLGAFLCALAAARPRLRIYVLAWDFAMIYALERDWPPVYRTAWQSHRGIVFQLDGAHPRGASHHQKLVVIDDRLAFVGGLDMTRARWDTPSHSADEPRRRDADGVSYRPFHDVQAMFDGDAAAELGEQARQRWRYACGRRVAIRAQRCRDDGSDPWHPARLSTCVTCASASPIRHRHDAAANRSIRSARSSPTRSARPGGICTSRTSTLRRPSCARRCRHASPTTRARRM